MNAADRRTADQKDQADRATVRDLQTAQALESARLQQEAKDLAANTPTQQAQGTQPGRAPQGTESAKKIKPVRVKTPPAKKTRLSAKKSAPKNTAKP